MQPSCNGLMLWDQSLLGIFVHFVRVKMGRGKRINGTDVGYGKFKLHSFRMNSMRMHVCTRMLEKCEIYTKHQIKSIKKYR